jgi:hypothetical protein
MRLKRWLVQPSDCLHERPAPSVICELLCDGVTVDGPRIDEGWVGERFVDAGDPVPLDGQLALGSTNVPNVTLPAGFRTSPPAFSAADLAREQRLPDFKVFISYRREDAAIAAQWAGQLVNTRFGAETAFVAPQSISMGFDFYECIHDALHRCRVMLVMIGKSWLSQTDEKGLRRIDSDWDWVRVEVRAGLDRGIPVIPVMVDAAALPTHAALPADLGRLVQAQGQFVRNDRFQDDLDTILEVIRRHL